MAMSHGHTAPPTTQREMLDREATQKVQEIKLTGELIHKFAEDADYFGTLATRLNAAAYRNSTELMPFTPAQLHLISSVATILRCKGVELGDAMAAGIVRRAVPIQPPYRAPRNTE